jgi:uncharacterized protein YgbK (DUF1537 family)
MTRALVIADDLTGAAEIAGIGLRYGLGTKLFRNRPIHFEADLTVIDSDSRSLAPADAGGRVGEFLSQIDPRQFDLIYKKTDSAMRGPLLAEVLAVLEELDLSDALLVPQNPSRGRTIVDGEYRINDVPLHQTSFAADPEHPARSADVLELLGKSQHQSISFCKPTQNPRNGITIGGAETLSDMRCWADRVTGKTLPAGGADFFTAILESRGLKPVRSALTRIDGARRLFVCGSASAHRYELVATAHKHGIEICPMPDGILAGADASSWISSAIDSLRKCPRVLIAVTQPLDRTPNISVRIQSVFCELAVRALAERSIDCLFLEGGATASAVCRRMGWNQLEIVGELATGVVQMRNAQSPAPQIVIKPGSYPWPDWVLAE